MQGIVSYSEKSAHLDEAKTNHISKVAQKWDHTIRRGLHRFARKQWSDEHLLGLIPVHRYRLRKQVQPGIYIWWVERDIPPYDRFLCEAYRVELSLTKPDQPQLIIRSGLSAYPVLPMSMEGLRMTLMRAGADTPLIIPRQFEPALDP